MTTTNEQSQQPTAEQTAQVLNMLVQQQEQAFIQEYAQLCQRHGCQMAVQAQVDQGGITRYFIAPRSNLRGNV